MKIKLVKNWKNCWKWFSIHCLALNAIILATWLYIPDDLRQALPHGLIAGIMFILGVLGRLIKQGDDDAKVS